MENLEYINQNWASYGNALAKGSESRSEQERTLITNVESRLNTILDSNVTENRSQIESILRLQLPAQLPANLVTKIAGARRTLGGGASGDSGSGNGNTGGGENKYLNMEALPKDMKVITQAANELSDADVQLYLEALTNFMKSSIYKVPSSEELSPERWTAAYASILVAFQENSTSTANSVNRNLTNSFTQGSQDYIWELGDLLRTINAAFKGRNISNPTRRYFRRKSDEINEILTKINYRNSERLAAKWGVHSGFRSEIGDAVPLHKMQLTPEATAAQIAATDMATSKKGADGSVVHVSQTLGKFNRR